MKGKLMALFVVGFVVLASASFAFAYQGDPNVQGPNYSEERHDAMQEVFENADYDAWVELMSENGRRPGVLRKVNAENFETFIAAHNAALDGDFETAKTLRESIGLNGLGRGQGKGKGHGRMSGKGNCQNRQ